LIHRVQKALPSSGDASSLAIYAALFLLYFVSGKLGLRLAFFHPSATPIWPDAGIAIAAFLLLGYRVWPVILVSAFVVNATTIGTVATSIGIAIGNTTEGLVGAYFVRRFAGGVTFTRHPQTLFQFAILAGMVSTTISATLGVTSLALGGYAAWAEYGSIWLTWWLGAAVGAILFTPLLVLLYIGPYRKWTYARALEALALGLYLILVSWVVFGDLLGSESEHYPLEFLCIPFVIWIAFRFGQLEGAAAVLLLSGISIWGTLHGYGAFVREDRNESLLLLQAFMGVIGLMTLCVGAVVSELRAVREELERKVETDSLTGLANYQKLGEVFGAEIERAGRHNRPFALLLFDLDGLKAINDEHGHLVGSQALCRVAAVMGLHTRAGDTAARFGGDEFAVLMPETRYGPGLRAAERLARRIAEDGQEPPLSISFGAAEYPLDGQTMVDIFHSADARLYEMKKHGGWKQAHRV
jgi:diguanylate cyclase (GGDEF)-like protein